MRCKNCGEKISSSNFLCPNCGAPIKSLSVKFKTTEMDEKKIKTKPKKEKPSTRAKLGAGPVPHRNEVSGAGPKIDTLFLSKKRKKNHRSRIIGSLFVALGFFLLGLLIFLAISNLTKPYGPAYLVPEDSSMYISFKIKQDIQFSTFKNILKKFPDYEKNEQDVKDKLKEENLDYDQDIKPWLGNELVLVNIDHFNIQNKNLRHPSENLVSRFAQNKMPVILVETKNKKETQKSLDKLVQKSKEKDKTSYKGIDIIAINEMSYTLLSNYLIISDEKENIKKIIETYKNNKNLAENKIFKKVKSNLSGDNLIFAYFDTKKLLKQTEKGKISNWQIVLNQEVAETIEGYGTTVAASNNGIKLKGYLYANEKKIKKLKRNFKTENFKPSLVNFLPVSSILYIEKSNLKKSIQELQEDLTKSNPMLKDYVDDFKNSLKDVYDIDIDEDIFSWMDCEYALILTPRIKTEKSNSELSFDLSVMFNLRDKNKVLEKMEKIKNVIQGKESTPIEDTQATEYILGNKIGLSFEEIEQKGEKIYSLPLPEFPDTSFNYCIFDHKLVFSTSSSAIVSILDIAKNSDKSFASDSTFCKTISEFPKENNGLFYINTQNLIDIINFAYPQINDIYLSYLKPIKAMGFTSESSENEITNYGFLLIE